MERVNQLKSVKVDRGIFLVRYASANDEPMPPKITVSPDQTSNQNISLVLHPDHNEAVLWQPGSCLVVQALEPGTLSIDVTPIQKNGSAAATIQIEPLTQGEAFSGLPSSAKDHSSCNFDDFRVLGHVASIGDVVVNANQWLAGPSAPSRIEGIAIEWPGKPHDLVLRYSVKTAKPQAVSGRVFEPGSFAGTRGKALPIVGLMLEMSGPGASDIKFTAEAIFLGAPAMRMTGTRVTASGPTGREPLVGLRLGIEAAGTTEAAGTAVKPQPGPSAAVPARPSSRVRVFRSRTSQGQPIAS
jgi:hypothetical protein